MITDRTGVLDLEATGGVGGRNVEHNGVPTPLLPLEHQILQEGGGGCTTEEGSSRTSVTPRKDTSSTSDFYGCPDKGHRFGPPG